MNFSISLYNELAIVNTRLLRAYSDLDERVPKLGIALKELAKVCDIGDASKGSLSSYSYIVMLIYFLQRISSPVLPFLQEVRLFSSLIVANSFLVLLGHEKPMYFFFSTIFCL